MFIRKEKRRCPRGILNSGANVSCKGRVLIGEPCNFSFHACIENISEGGLKIVLAEKIKKGSLLQLDLFVTEKLPLKCLGTVIWTKKVNPNNPELGHFNTGIEFTDIDPFYRKMVKNLTETFISRKQ